MKKKKKFFETVPISANLDRNNKMLKTIYAVENINYVTNNGIIQNGWLIADEQDIDEAIKLLQKQAAPMYILGRFYSAIIGWDRQHRLIEGSLWKDGKSVDEVSIDSLTTVELDKLRKKMIEWLNKTIKGSLK